MPALDPYDSDSDGDFLDVLAPIAIPPAASEVVPAEAANVALTKPFARSPMLNLVSWHHPLLRWSGDTFSSGPYGSDIVCPTHVSDAENKNALT